MIHSDEGREASTQHGCGGDDQDRENREVKDPTAGVLDRYVRVLPLLLFMAALPRGIAAQEVRPLADRQLWTGCSILEPEVYVSDGDDDLSGLTEATVMRAVSSRLRAARLHHDGEQAFVVLRVDVWIVGRAFHVEVELRRIVWIIPGARLDSSEDAIIATTWSDSTLGTHGGDPSFVLSSVSEKMDHFIDEYLRVNGSACA